MWSESWMQHALFILHIFRLWAGTGFLYSRFNCVSSQVRTGWSSSRTVTREEADAPAVCAPSFLFLYWQRLTFQASELLPGGPIGPVTPGSPDGPWEPFTPLGPTGHWGPGEPGAPLHPFTPLGPIGPSFPLVPLEPLGLMGPGDPWEPRGPIGPWGPGGPVHWLHVDPCETTQTGALGLLCSKSLKHSENIIWNSFRLKANL